MNFKIAKSNEKLFLRGGGQGARKREQTPYFILAVDAHVLGRYQKRTLAIVSLGFISRRTDNAEKAARHQLGSVQFW